MYIALRAIGTRRVQWCVSVFCVVRANVNLCILGYWSATDACGFVGRSMSCCGYMHMSARSTGNENFGEKNPPSFRGISNANRKWLFYRDADNAGVKAWSLFIPSGSIIQNNKLRHSVVRRD